MHLLFLPTTFATPLAPSRHKPVTTCSPSMTNKPAGFGKKPRKPPSSDASKRRQSASDRYDQMAAAGMPEYSIWIRLRTGGIDNPDQQMPWLPVGCLSVPRSSQVSSAIFDSEEDLMQGAIRLYPNLQNEPSSNIQYGYQLRQFDDEEIKLAERQVPGVQSTLRKWFRALQNPLNPAQ